MSPVFTSACARGVGAGLVNRCLRPRVWSLAARGRDAAPAPPAFASSASSSRFSASSTSSSSSFTAWAVERNGAGVDASASARCARRSRSRHRGGGGAIPAHLRSRPRGVLVRSTSSAAAEDALRLVQDRLGVTLSEEPTVPPPHPAVVVVSGPSGVGKDAVVRRLRALRPELHFFVTATSRAPRPGGGGRRGLFLRLHGRVREDDRGRRADRARGSVRAVQGHPEETGARRRLRLFSSFRLFILSSLSRPA